MALLKLTPTSGSPASIQVDEIDIYRVTSSAAGGSTVVYSGPSAFLGDQQTVIVNESISTVDSLSTALIQLTIGSQVILINAFNIFDVVTDAVGSKIMYKEFGNITYLFAAQTPAQVKTLVNTALSAIKIAQPSAPFSGVATASAADVCAGILVCNDAAPMALNLPTPADMANSGMKVGSTLAFYVQSIAAGDVSLVVPFGGTSNTSNSAAFVAPNTPTTIGGNRVAKYEMFFNTALTYILSRVY